MASAEQQPQSLNIQLLVDSIPALIHTARPDGYIDYFNKPWLEYLGVTLDEMAGWNWTSFIHPEDVDGIVARWRACLASGEIFEYETRVRSANGEYRWMYHHKVPLRDAGGNIVKWYGSSLDIDERKATEEQLRRNTHALQRSEFYLAEGQRLAHLGSWALDPGGFYYWSPELFRMHGLDPAGKPPSVQEYLDCLHPHDRETMADLIKGIFANASSFDATKRIVRPNGEVRYIRCVGVPVLENQSLKKYVGSALDVTEHELLTQRLRRREAYLAEAQKLSHTGSWAWNPATGEPGYWSEECYRVLGFDPAGPPPPLETIFQRIQPDDARAAVRDQFERGIRDKADFELEMNFDHPTKGIRNILSTGHPVVDSLGELREVVGTVIDITERKRAEEAIRRSGAYLAEAQRLSHTGSFGWKPDSGEIFWSEETYRIFEYDPAEKPTVSTLLPRTHPQDKALVQQVIERASKTGTDFEHEYRLLLPSGAIKHVRALAQAIPDASGNLEFVGAVSDISEQRRAEAVIREQEAELREVLDSIPAVVWSALPDGSNSYANKRSVEYCGMTREQIAGSGWEAGFHPDDLERHKAKWLACVASGEPCEDEVRFRRADGQYRWHLQRGVPLRDEAGNIVKWYGVLTDIEDRKSAEGKIRDQEAEFRQIVDLAPQLVAVYGPELERLYCNRMALDYQGVSLDEWRQMERGGLVHPDDSERLKASWDRALASGSAHEVELRQRKHDGSYRWFLARYHPVRDDKGQIKRWYVTATDIEDRKQAEDRLRSENVALREEIDKASMFEEIVGTSRALQTVLSRISKVAPSDSTVLITGETGTGKELVARAIHRRSDRASRAFVSVSCAAIPRELIASELFGHEKGAFTGATQQRLGRFELANGGTLFLDEVGELPLETQIALLRVLQEHEFERVGGTRPIRIDVRVIAATNRDLEAAISAGSFRSDLFYRLNVFPIEIPPLRERQEDIQLLVEYFIDRYARKAGKNITSVDKNTLRLLESYPWPGNIRELQNVIERSVIVCETENFSVDESWLSQHPSNGKTESQLYLSEKVAAQEKEIIEAALLESQGRVFGPSGAAAKLGIARSTLESKIRSLKINKNRFKA
jgi:PAS domain S-box-containing protein